MDRVSSRQNPIVKRFREVARGELHDAMLLDGEHLIQEALAADVPLQTVATLDRLSRGAVADRAQRAGARLIVVSDAVLSAISPVRTPSGIVAIASRPVARLEDVLARTPPLVVMLHDVQDPGNVGAIARAAEACGATGLVCSEGTADPFGWKALRGAMGSTLRLPTAARQFLPDAIDRARASGLRVFALTTHAGTPLQQCDLRTPAAIVLGGEGAGLPTHILDAVDTRLTIPMHAPVESLNVAVAAALVMYEASRQRTALVSNQN
jgi:TrmH family RNA methyltransferase